MQRARRSKAEGSIVKHVGAVAIAPYVPGICHFIWFGYIKPGFRELYGLIFLSDDIVFDCESAGQVQRVKVLGALPMIDEGETDWKVIVVAEGTELHGA